MAVQDKDNRLQFPATVVDFDNTVGITGQAHDNYPAGGQQPRWDWMRMTLIGLLSHQSSTQPPTQYRIGTVWFNKTKKAFYAWDGNAWESLASFIDTGLTETGEIVSLADQMTVINEKIEAIQPRYVYNGRCERDNVVSIPVPTSIQTALGTNPYGLRPVVYIDGIQVDPRKSSFSGNDITQVKLTNGAKLSSGDRFTVMIEKLDVFIVEDVVIS